MVEGDFDKEDENFLNLKFNIDPLLWKNFSSFSTKYEKTKVINNILMPTHVKAQRLKELEFEENQMNFSNVLFKNEQKKKSLDLRTLLNSPKYSWEKKLSRIFTKSKVKVEEKTRLFIVNEYLQGETNTNYFFRNNEYYEMERRKEQRLREIEELEKSKLIEVETNEKLADQDNKAAIDDKIPSQSKENSQETIITSSDNNSNPSRLDTKNDNNEVKQEPPQDVKKQQTENLSTDPLPSFFDQTNIAAFPAEKS